MSDITLLRGGYVYTSDPEIENQVADVLIEDGVIAAIATNVHLDGLHNVTAIDVTDSIVMPGLIDTHRHLWRTNLRQIAADSTIGDHLARTEQSIRPRFRPDDVAIANLVGSLEALDSGVTTIMDRSHIVHSPEHGDAAVLGLAGSGIRAVYGYGLGSMPAPEWYERDVRRVASAIEAEHEPFITLALSSGGPEFADLDSTIVDLALARSLGIRTSIHAGVGLLGQARIITELDRRGLLGPDLVFVHASTATDEELRLIASSDGAVSVSARIEMQMGHGYPATGRMIEAGIAPSLSVALVSGVTGNMFAEMRAVGEAERARQNSAAIDRGEWVAARELTTAEVIEMATINGARALGLGEITGSLTPGKQADIIVIRRKGFDAPDFEDVPAAILASEPSSISHVLVGGTVLKRDGRLVGHDLEQLHEFARASREFLLAE